MMTSPVSAKFEASFTADAGYPSRLAPAFFRHISFKPSRWVPWILVAVFLFVIGVVMGNNVWIIGLAVPIAIGVTVPLTISRMRRRFARNLPPGSTIALSLDDDAISLKFPLGSGDTRYAAFQSVLVAGGFVFLRHRASKFYSCLPGELFTPDALNFLRDKIASASAAPVAVK
jgi:hypothetical protein